MLSRRAVYYAAVILVFTFVGTGIAQDVDYSTIVTDSEDPVAPDSVVNYEVAVANAGPSDPPGTVILDIYLPMDVPVPWQEYLEADGDTRTAINDAWFDTANFLIDDNIWDADVSGTYMGDSFNNACEGMIVQPQELVLPAGTGGSFYYDTVLPAAGGVSGLAWETAAGDRTAINYGVGGCNSVLFEDCVGIPCMGPRLTMVPAAATPVTIAVAEPGADNGLPSEGCGALIDFPAGHIALIDRGSCSFSVKGDMATQAGAAGVIVANSAALGGETPTGDSVMTMGCTDAVCHSLLTTIPAAFVSYNDGEALKALIAAGDPMVYMGVREETPEYQQTIAYIWSNDGNDTNPENDTYRETTEVSGALFADGFESGDPYHWDFPEQPQSPLALGTWQWMIDYQCTSSFALYGLIFSPHGLFSSPDRCSGFEDSWFQIGSTVGFSFSTCDGSYTGTINRDGTFMSGTSSWGGCWQAEWMF